MIYRILIPLVFVLSFYNCSKDEANQPDDLSENCSQAELNFEENIIGTWSYNVTGPGTVKINEDGTYEDIEGEIISNGPIAERNWRIDSDRMVFDIENASLSLRWKDFSCDSVTFDGEGFLPDLVFTRIQ